MFTIADVPSPVSNRDTDVVQTGGSDIREIRFSDELLPRHKRTIRKIWSDAPSPREGRERAYAVPVIFEHALGDGTDLVFAESPFVDDVGVTGVVEKTGSDPWLRN